MNIDVEEDIFFALRTRDDRVTYRISLCDPTGPTWKWFVIGDLKISGGFKAVCNHVGRYYDWTIYDPTDNVEEYYMRVSAPNCEKVYFKKVGGRVVFVGYEELAKLGITSEVR